MKTVRRSVPVLALLALASLASLAWVPEAQAQSTDKYAAIAYSPQTGRYGYAYNYSTLASAQQQALWQCGAADARVVVWARNAYVALALGDRLGAHGYAWATDPGTARALALREARKHTSGCYIAVCVGP